MATGLAAFLACSWALGAQESETRLEHVSARAGLPLAMASVKPEGALRVVLGALGASVARSLPLLAEALETADLDAVAVGSEDLAVEAPGFRELLASPRIPFVCANVKGAGRSHVVRRVGGVRLAFVGVTKVPTHRKSALQAWTIEDPVAVLRTLLPEITKEADSIVLLAVMDRIECAHLLRELPEISLALVPAVGGNDPEPLWIGNAWLVQSPAGAATLGRLAVKFEGKKAAQAANRIEPVVLTEKDRERWKALHARHQEDIDPARWIAATDSSPPLEAGPPTSLQAGKTQPLGLVRSDRSVEIEVHSVRTLSTYRNRNAGESGLWLAVDNQWKNIIPMTYVFERQVPTTFSVLDASNNLYLIVNGKSLVRLDPDLSEGPGGLLDKRAILLETLGSTRRGNVIFPMPAAGVETLDLRYYDFRHGHIAFPLLRRPPGAPPIEAKPVVPLGKNEIMEVGVFGLRRAKSLVDRQAPEGMTFALLDFRARSLVTVEADATAFNPKAGPKDKIQIGAAGDLQDGRKDLRLVIDGGRAEIPGEGSSLPLSPRFLPDVLTGGDLVYIIPEKTVSLELRCEFGDIALPDGRVVRPRPITLLLEGKEHARKVMCPACKRATGPNDKFCGECGTRIER